MVSSESTILCKGEGGGLYLGLREEVILPLKDWRPSYCKIFTSKSMKGLRISGSVIVRDGSTSGGLLGLRESWIFGKYGKKVGDGSRKCKVYRSGA